MDDFDLFEDIDDINDEVEEVKDNNDNNNKNMNNDYINNNMELDNNNNRNENNDDIYRDENNNDIYRDENNNDINYIMNTEKNIEDNKPNNYDNIFISNNEDDMPLLSELLVYGKICSSKREAREFVKNGSITLNGEKIIDLDFVLTKDKCIDNKYFIIRRGKKKYFVGVYN